MIEMNKQLIEPQNAHHLSADNAEAELCVDTETRPCSAIEFMYGNKESDISTSVLVKDEVLDNTESNYSADSQTNEIPNQTNPVSVVTESKSCPKIQLELKPIKADKTEANLVLKQEIPKAPDDFVLEPCTKNGTNNDDMHSEVSNPNMSPKHVISSLTMSSHLDVVGIDHGGCGEITSVCCEEEHSKSVVLEIPKHVRPSGIRKITFKFSKRKVDHDGDLSADVKPLDDDKIGEGFYDNQVTVSPDVHLAGNGFRNQEWSTLENEEINLSTLYCVPNRELKMSKKVVVDNYPTNIKKLLSTGILDGAKVKYISVSGMKELIGIIKDGGYLCSCCNCNFSKVVSAYEFELHAGVKTRHPNNHIYLENGKPIYSIIQELRTAPLSTVGSVMKSVAGSAINEKFFKVWIAKLQNGNSVAYAGRVYQIRHFGMSHCTTRNFIEESPYPALSQYSHVTSFNQSSYMESPLEQKRLIKKPRHSFWEQKKVGEGGNKKRDNDLHKLLFMPNGLPDGTSLAYYSKGKRILGGYKQGNGIVCSCCDSEISPSQFESHAGWAVKRQPYRHIYTSSGLTLHDIALMLANGQNITSSFSDDMCAVCGDGGELIICNGCPRAFHADCLGLQSLPADDWHCQYCRDRFGPGRKVSAESRHIILRLKRVVKAPEFEPGGCCMCRSQDFSAAKFDDRTVIICDQCEKEYHVGCLREAGLCDLKELPEDKWFCRDECHKIFQALENLACSRPEVIPASVSATLYEKHAKVCFGNTSFKDEIQWCILSGKSRFPEHVSLLSQAAAIFRERFDPIVAKSGRDLIPVMVYGRNISGQEFSGMYCVVLVVQSVVVSAALLRIFGRDVAELPLVATCQEYQGKGYFQALFSCIENLLSSMSVKHLVLPAAEEAEPMWTNKLGFRKTSNEQNAKVQGFSANNLQGDIFVRKGGTTVAKLMWEGFEEMDPLPSGACDWPEKSCFHRISV
ncbi:hypothetical protein CASFOL_009195 [Castilleja foliolosa]|uniref:PHD-type domain-containing protein n=1 Tax=Castilleja foliolosa TaxID=1961234 RepID=A0ABD3DXX5_9LAMI